MEKKLDLRGLSCPMPLMETQKALAEVAAVTAIVDEPAAKENLIKFAKSKNYQVECTSNGGEYTLIIRK
ncbi:MULTISPECIES: sulfurtransferase TusA family protein [Sporomusa]|jgi:tRNA 2-thiouridine synthesizing protein A|uniref:SirA-like protein n=1 Tax=Sporomusa sphaeroides DSM 2875 TaxID=1337886 RepID=A0ABM9VZ21_9FIRM|nr:MULTISPECIES: sulfurtransferase TusA family protein [Sporomusa]MCM0759744.1 sulfurtransferase TusA family protein [Sporomusa sphaeroides DSM 2875]OLS57342.1 SirA-like protein [Sporomusa sphaeroides DSM 2875]CVK18100.1 SirA-like protein [Sporomusa sphaeroides DSM 2875]HML33684.1 sulfurtransferase TusA family protein [Sporomusa sphaeroides]